MVRIDALHVARYQRDPLGGRARLVANLPEVDPCAVARNDVVDVAHDRAHRRLALPLVAQHGLIAEEVHVDAEPGGPHLRYEKVSPLAFAREVSIAARPDRLPEIEGAVIHAPAVDVELCLTGHRAKIRVDVRVACGLARAAVPTVEAPVKAVRIPIAGSDSKRGVERAVLEYQ